MDKKQFRNTIIQDAVNKDAENRTITFVASDETLNRHGHVVKANWDLKNFKANPVVFLNHRSDELPIGVVEKVWVDETKLMAKIRFAESDANPVADSVYKLYNAGILKAVSAGYLTDYDNVEVKESKKLNEKYLVLNGPHELLEISACGLPSNPKALKENVLQNAVKAGVIDELEMNDLVINMSKYTEEETVETKEPDEKIVDKLEQTIVNTESVEDMADPYDWFFLALDSAKADLNKVEDINSIASKVCESLRGDSKKDSKQTIGNLDDILSKFIDTETK